MATLKFIVARSKVDARARAEQLRAQFPDLKVVRADVSQFEFETIAAAQVVVPDFVQTRNANASFMMLVEYD